MLEAGVQALVRVRAAEMGIHLFRNNSGVAEGENGRPIRFGLANDSAQLNKRLKSGDLIGILPCVVGGIFLSVECKRTDWHGGFPNAPRPDIFDDREKAQQAWIDLVRSQGGIAGFVRCVEEFEALVK